MAQGRPRVEIREFDQTTSVENQSLFTGGLAGYTQKGPIGVPTLITNSKQFEEVFGSIGWNSSYNNAYVSYAADQFFQFGNALYILRGDVTDSKFGYIDVVSAANANGQSAVSAVLNNAVANVASALSAADSNGEPTAAPTTTALRVYTKYKNSADNNNIKVGILNWGYFTSAEYQKTQGVLGSGPRIDYPPTSATPDQFYIAVYSSAGTLLEQYVASLISSAVNGRGDNIYAEEFINNNSSYIYVKVNPSVLGTSTNTIEGFSWNAISANGLWASISGSSAANVVSGAYEISAASLSAVASLAATGFANKDEYPIRALAVPGLTGSWSTLTTLADARKDFVAILDAPRTTVESTISARYATTNSTYAVLYSNWWQYYDARNDKYIYLPPSIQAMIAYQRTKVNFESWYAPAGARRGRLVNIQLLDKVYTDGELDILATNQINPLTRLRPEGYVIWGQKTLWPFASDFRDLNIRFLFIEIEDAISKYARSLIFEFNDSMTRYQAKLAIDSYLEGIKNRGGIYEFAVVCDSTNNTDQVISNNELVIDIFVKATKVAEVIKLNFVASRDLVQINR